MSFFHVDVHSEFFTPPEFPVEILNTARKHDVVTCCLPPPAKQFLAFMLFKEFYYNSDGISVFIQDDPQILSTPADSTDLVVVDNRLKQGEQSSSEDPDSEDAEDHASPKQPSKSSSNHPPSCEIPLKGLSCVPVLNLQDKGNENSSSLPSDKSSIVVQCSCTKFLQLAKTESPEFDPDFLPNLTLVVIDDVHKALKDQKERHNLRELLRLVRCCNYKRSLQNSQPQIRLVFLSVSLLHYYGHESNGFWRMKETFKQLELLCGARVDTSSDIVALLRYAAPLTERLVPVSSLLRNELALKLTQEIMALVLDTRASLLKHSFNAIRALGYDSEDVPELEQRLVKRQEQEDNGDDNDSLLDELARIPHPNVEPLKILEHFELILNLFGPWCANRALYLFVNQLCQLKIRVPYVRHYVLLGFLHTRFAIMQTVFEEAFEKLDPVDLLENYSTPKLLAMLNVLRRFDLTTPHEHRAPREDPDKGDDDSEITVADYLKQQKAEQAAGGRGARFGGRRRHNRNKFDERQRRKLLYTNSDEKTTTEGEETAVSADGGEKEKNDREKSIEKIDDENADAHKSSENAASAEVVVDDKVYEQPVSEKVENENHETPALVSTEAQNRDESVTPATTSAKPARVRIRTRGRKVNAAAAAAAAAAANGQAQAETPAVPEEETAEPKQESSSSPTVRFQRRNRFTNRLHEDALCGIILLEDRFNARLVYHFLKEIAEFDKKLVGLNPTIALSSNPEYAKDSRDAEMEYKKREEALRKFRYREANLLVGTSLLEDGLELPKANLVIRFDESKSFRSYLLSKGRAQGMGAEFYVFTPEQNLTHCLRQLATYKIVEETLLSHTIIERPMASRWSAGREEEWNVMFPKFKSAQLSNAISIINRYCARLPSDTFTRLVPSWWIDVTDAADDQDDEKADSESEKRFSCSLRLPINSPVKWTITGVPMPSEVLAKRAVALQTVVVLHANGELDDSLMPVGKEGVSQEPDLCTGDDVGDDDMGEFRPGSTRRRQYYDKQLAPHLIGCLPRAKKEFYLYWLKMELTCPLPDEQNTRGRKLHPPEMAEQAFGIALSKEIPAVPPFPIYTRCGEVQVQLVRVISDENMETITEDKLKRISVFHHYTFTSVLRLDKYLTLFDPESSENSYYVVPLKVEDIVSENEEEFTKSVRLDWKFLDRIYEDKSMLRPNPLSDEARKNYEFREKDYLDAVVMPWYRNNDQPQFFYVAEICENLTPQSQFPGCEFKTFEEYYQRKYHIGIQNPNQPLLDVDHTSARLNFLTPRYVNRKGMALPTSSENTKRAKRENLEQKQILVPELCAIHPFSASLWRQAVCLPCILYRVNTLLLANSIRNLVATHVKGLGTGSLPSDYEWESLSFGWSLSDVVGFTCAATKPKKVRAIGTESAEAQPEPESKAPIEKDAKEKEKVSDYGAPTMQDGSDTESEEEKEKENKNKEKAPKVEEKELSGFEKAAKEPTPAGISLAESLLMNDKSLGGKSLNEILSEQLKNCRPPQLEIGVWSNDMAGPIPAEPDYDEEEDELLDPNVALPSNLMMLDKNWTWGGRSKLFNHRVHRALYGSPTHWGEVWDEGAFEPPEDFDDGDNNSVASDLSGSDESYLDGDNNLKIQFEGNTAEALDKRKFGTAFDHRLSDEWTASEDLWWNMDGFESEEKKLERDNKSPLPLDKEERMRIEFDTKVDEKVREITNIVKWDELDKLPAREIRQKPPEEDAPPHIPNPHYETLFKILTPIEPPKVLIDLNCTANTHSAGRETKEEESSAFQKKPESTFSFDYQPCLANHPGPSPCQILQALTMSNANDGLNLERLETIGDSFLKYAITSYLFCTFENIHEGKLSHLRSKQVSNVHLYRLGRKRGLGGIMVAAKFEPHDNWLPPGYHIPKDLDKAFIQSKLPPSHFSMAQVNALKGLSPPEIENALKNNTLKYDTEFIPYNLVTQQSIPDKSIADCVEALIGAYLTSTGPYGALLFMSWLGMRVLPSKVIPEAELPPQNPNVPQYYMPIPSRKEIILFEKLSPPKSPLLRYIRDADRQLEILLKGYNNFEETIGYKFRDRSYLLQAFTHASYTSNTLTDCYQRLEFLGDAILDYLITRHLYEDPRQHSPGSLTDLRSALVNNTIFASLAVKSGFHKYFRHSSPGLSVVLQKFVTFQEQHAHTLTQDFYLMGEEECEEAEDIEVPKALGDVFESVAGAIFLDSNMSLDAVWDVYYRIMKNEIDQFSQNVPKSPIRELLELEPETAKFGKPEKLWDGRRVRVTVEIFGVGIFRGIGRNYRIAKCTAAKCALRHVRKHRGQGHSR